MNPDNVVEFYANTWKKIVPDTRGADEYINFYNKTSMNLWKYLIITQIFLLVHYSQQMVETVFVF